MTDYTKLTIEELEAEQAALEKALEEKKRVDPWVDVIADWWEAASCPDYAKVVRQAGVLDDDGKEKKTILQTLYPKLKAVMEPDSAPDSAGWVEWHGGECPVEDGELVEVRFRDGGEATNANLKLWCWEHRKSAGDIVAYRICE